MSSLEVLLAQEKLQCARRALLASSFASSQQQQEQQQPQHRHQVINPIWRQALYQWYLHVISSFQEFQLRNNAPNTRCYTKSIATIAMQILDMYLSCGCCNNAQFQMAATKDSRVFKALGWACLYIALRDAQTNSASHHDDDDSNKGKMTSYYTSNQDPQENHSSMGDNDNNNDNINTSFHLSEMNFLQMCHATHELSIEDFSSLVDSISSFLIHFEEDVQDGTSSTAASTSSLIHPPTPIATCHFYNHIQRYLLHNFSHLPIFSQDEQRNAYFQRVQALLEYTLSNTDGHSFSRYPSSVLAIAAFMVAMPGNSNSSARSSISISSEEHDAHRSVLLYLLTYYRVSGGYDLACLQEIVIILRTVAGGVAAAEMAPSGSHCHRGRSNRGGFPHVIPVSDD